MIALSIDLRDNLTPRLRRLQAEARAAVVRGVSRATLIMEGIWKRHLSGPGSATRLGVRSGQMRASVTHRIDAGGMTGVVGSAHPGIRIHEFGGVIVPKRAAFLRFEVGGQVVYAKKVTMPRRPHLAPAWEEAQPRMREAFEKSLQEAIRG